MHILQGQEFTFNLQAFLVHLLRHCTASLDELLLQQLMNPAYIGACNPASVIRALVKPSSMCLFVFIESTPIKKYIYI